jgi:hypothetical protein
MSDTDDNTENTSFLSNLKNTVKYKAHKAVYNPDANKFAENQKAINEQNKKEEEQKKQLEEQNKENATDTTELSVGLVFNETISQIKSLAAKIIIPFIALLIAMFVANDMIIYPRPIRLIAFIVVLLFCTLLPFYMGIFILYYLLKVVYAWYKRHLSDKGNSSHHQYMPTIFTLLPITTSNACSAFGRFFYYPINYPKFDKNAYETGGKLKEIMNNYLGDLISSFTDFDKYKSQPLFVKLLNNITDNFSKMHLRDIPKCGTDSSALQASNVKETPAEATVVEEPSAPKMNENEPSGSP